MDSAAAKRPRPTEEEEDLSSTHQHLGQIDRAKLDFDAEKQCSVTLSPQRVHCCLVCGKYLQGRGGESPLVLHSLHHGHFVCLCLSTGVVYSFQQSNNGSSGEDGAAVVSEASLEDIQFNLRPRFSEADIAALAGAKAASASASAPLLLTRNRDLHGNTFLPGVLAIQQGDYLAAVVQSLVRVDPLRAFFLRRQNFEHSASALVRAFGELVCQLFNPRRFKSTVRANELVRVVAANSKFASSAAAAVDASQFLAWFLFELNKGLMTMTTDGDEKKKKKKKSIVHECFQGEVRVETTVIELKREFGAADAARPPLFQPGPASSSSSSAPSAAPAPSPVMATGEELGTFTRANVLSTKVEHVKFLSLALELPTTPLFKDSLENQTVIPQTTLLQVLEKYNGQTVHDVPLPGGRLERRRYVITRLPPHLVLHLKRFTSNQFFVEKNRALVTLPVANLDMAPYTTTPSLPSSYRLVANVCHSDHASAAAAAARGGGTYKANVYYKPKDAWFELGDDTAKESMPQLVAVSETLLAFYERQ